jgi:DNA (cytosine-5)-methyltransferase 1
MNLVSEISQQSFFDLLEEEKASPFIEMCDCLGVPMRGYWHDLFGDALQAWIKKNNNRKIRTLSLFAGAGGLDIGFHDAGFTISHAVEIDERFAKTLMYNSEPDGYISGTKIICKDIRNFSLPKGTQIDFIIGGPPCQTFSAAGRRAAGVKGTQDARGTLFEEYVRLLNELQPEGFFFENVYGIIGAEGGKAWQDIQEAFLGAGYNISSRIVDAADYGVAQHRERLLIVGWKAGKFLFPRPTHGPDAPNSISHVNAMNVLPADSFSTTKKGSLGGRYGYLLDQIPPGLNYSYFTEKFGHPKPIFAWRSKFSDFLYKADPDRPVRTLKAQGGQYTGPFHWENRAFSESELKRLQSFPDRYHIEGRRQVVIHQIGNSVPPQLARIIALGVRYQIFNQNVPVQLPTLREDETLGFRKRKRALSGYYKAKAADAISKLIIEAKVERESRTYRANLGESFKWKETEDGCLIVKTEEKGNLWNIHVSNSSNSFSFSPVFTIEITANSNKPWSLGATVVRLSGYGELENVFTAVWKAFEAELILHGIKADLVQLCEYYQYLPRFSCNMRIYVKYDWRWEALKQVVSGVGTREIVFLDELANLLDIDEASIIDFATFLKELGYEARNSKTNSQIGEDNFLIPYAFPTLTPLSVQLRKRIATLPEII